MGCDIHLYQERLVNGVWQSADEWEDNDVVYKKSAYNNRNYEFFGTLSKGVRTEPKVSFAPRGLPLRPSVEVAMCFAGWDVDAHSASHLRLAELVELREVLKDQTITVDGMMHRDQWAELRASIDAGAPNWDKLFPYCRFTTQRDHEDFSVDVPALLYIGNDLGQVIESLIKIGGDDQRIVFWFDN